MDQAATSSNTNNHGSDPWQLLRALTLFRLLSCLFFVCAPFLSFTQEFLALSDRPVLLAIAGLYSLSGVSMAVLFLRQQPNLNTQVSMQIYADIIFITLLMHQLGGVESGVGILLCASLSGTALLRQTNMGYLFAAIATLAVLGQTVLEEISSSNQLTHYPQAAALCIALFVVSFLSTTFNRHRIASSAVIISQQQQLAGLQSLSNEILRQFDHGLLAITSGGLVAHSNPTAMRLLGYQNKQQSDKSLAETAPSLHRFLLSGRDKGTVQHRGTELYITRKWIENNVQLVTLVLQSKQEAEANQLKLATLGQWTASVAHEIRNPLSAISQAAELLLEYTPGTSKERRLAEIVHRNSNRIDLIVTDILNLARPSKYLEETTLVHWLESVAKEISEVNRLAESRISVSGNQQLVQTIDKNKLQHVIENLCKNSLAHGGTADISIHIEVKNIQGSAVIRFRDTGQGVSDELRTRLFDPFYTKSDGGTGLGLFIAREICEQHHIDLTLCENDRGAVFELRFKSRPTQTNHLWAA